MNRDEKEQQEEENMLMEQLQHIHKLIVRQDGAENIMKLVTAEKNIAEMIMARNMMDRMG